MWVTTLAPPGSHTLHPVHLPPFIPALTTTAALMHHTRHILHICGRLDDRLRAYA